MEDSDLMLEIVDRANRNSLSRNQMEEALEGALLGESNDVEDQLRGMRDFFHEKIHTEGIAANRLQRLIRSVVTFSDTLKQVEKMRGVIQMLADQIQISCEEQLEPNVVRTLKTALARRVLTDLSLFFLTSALLDFTVDDVEVFSVNLVHKDASTFSYTGTFATSPYSPIGRFSLAVSGYWRPS